MAHERNKLEDERGTSGCHFVCRCTYLLRCISMGFFRHKLKLNNWKAQVHSFMSKFYF